ncbi:MAG: alpha/beta hydrolase, partial [Casimicrobiaceae bacterium]|nr:alpha/beta hydrolase [Casimicrobiaceae bacterium]
QPILMVVGSQAGSKWMSEDLIRRAASTDKTLHVVEGGNHMSFYDVPQYVSAAVGQLVSFFRRTLS